MDQMQSILNQYNSMPTANPGDITGTLLNKVQGFAPQINAQRTMQAQAYASPASLLDQYNQRYGNVGGVDAMTRLNSVLSNIGQQQGSANALGSIINTQGGNLNSLSSNILNAYNAQRGDLQNRFNMADTVYKDQLAGSAASSAALPFPTMNMPGAQDSSGVGTIGTPQNQAYGVAKALQTYIKGIGENPGVINQIMQGGGAPLNPQVRAYVLQGLQGLQSLGFDPTQIDFNKFQ